MFLVSLFFHLSRKKGNGKGQRLSHDNSIQKTIRNASDRLETTLKVGKRFKRERYNEVLLICSHKHPHTQFANLGFLIAKYYMNGYAMDPVNRRNL